MLQGIQIARGSPRINHILFADDCLILVKAELPQLDKLKRLLALYETLAGQRIKYTKSEMRGSGNIDKNMLTVCGDFLDMKIIDGIPKYLGLPLAVERSKTKMFQWLESKVQSRIQEWNASFLSTAGKEVLIKSCLQSYPLYAMTCFRIPRTLCDK